MGKASFPKGHLALDPLRLLTSERPVADWNCLYRKFQAILHLRLTILHHGLYLCSRQPLPLHTHTAKPTSSYKHV